MDLLPFSAMLVISFLSSLLSTTSLWGTLGEAGWLMIIDHTWIWRGVARLVRLWCDFVYNQASIKGELGFLVPWIQALFQKTMRKLIPLNRAVEYSQPGTFKAKSFKLIKGAWWTALNITKCGAEWQTFAKSAWWSAWKIAKRVPWKVRNGRHLLQYVLLDCNFVTRHFWVWFPGTLIQSLNFYRHL